LKDDYQECFWIKLTRKSGPSIRTKENPEYDFWTLFSRCGRVILPREKVRFSFYCIFLLPERLENFYFISCKTNTLDKEPLQQSEERIEDSEILEMNKRFKKMTRTIERLATGLNLIAEVSTMPSQLCISKSNCEYRSHVLFRNEMTSFA
jgi:hypothetical protein